ncbi:acetolactate synthase, regulatory subunit [Elasticomyces elasticus]|uniref:Acetolactate synthase, regulatory subunit n=1 Tax=Elasticomyces elasticus TaxID=574655 RepID=A0AAN7W7F3_9PEZI|nr:acetolactate synthase, regulatory subunit [Elasticomyces elasticus]
MASKRAFRLLQTSTKPTFTPRRHQSSSTSAIAYKALHRRASPFPTASPPSPTVSPAAAVSSILYETPLPSSAPAKKHILNCLVQNEPGVLSRVSGILAARGFNIDSLVVCSTEVQDLSRMTIVLQGQDGVVEQARRQLEDLVPVWAVLDYTAAPLVQRELLLAKISILGPEYFEELLAHHREMTDYPADQQQHTQFSTNPSDDATQELTPDQLADRDDNVAHQNHQQSTQQPQHPNLHQSSDIDFHPHNLAPSEALRLKHQHLETLTYLTHQFGGKVLDISTNNCIVEVSAKPTRIDSFMKLVAPFGILESARTGLMALPRSPLHAVNEEVEKEVEDIIDAASLPPS